MNILGNIFIAWTNDTAISTLDSKIHGANIEPIWGRQGPGGPHVDPMNLAIVQCS